MHGTLRTKHGLRLAQLEHHGISKWHVRQDAVDVGSLLQTAKQACYDNTVNIGIN